MFSRRGLFLVVTISLASVTLAGVFLQAGYEHQDASSKSEVVSHDNNVADSLLPEHEPTNTIDKHVGKRTIEWFLQWLSKLTDFQFTFLPFLNSKIGANSEITFPNGTKKVHFIPFAGATVDPSVKINMRKMTMRQLYEKLPTAPEKIANTNVIPLYSEMTPKTYYQYPDTAVTPTSVQPGPPFVIYMQNPYDNKEEYYSIYIDTVDP